MLYNDKLPAYINDLINARKEKKLSQIALARRVGCKPHHLSKIERGRALPSGTMLVSLSDVLGLQIRLIKPTAS